MEFKYRATEDPPLPPPPPSIDCYSTTIQPMPGGIFGMENRRSDLMQSRVILRLELKEQIREEFMAMRREIESEIRLEMAIEKELSLRAETNRFSSSLPLDLQRTLQRTVGLPLRTQQLMERGAGEKLVPIFRGNSVGAAKFVSVEDGVTRTVSDVGDKGEEMIVGKSPVSPILTGSKREASCLGELELATLKKARNDWSCSLCQVSTTSEKTLEEHLKGRKHKSREKLLVTESVARNGGDLRDTIEWEEKLQQVGITKAGMVTMSPFRCDLCNVICNSEVVLDEHLRGKRHVARVPKLVGGSAVTVPHITTGMKEVQKSEEEVMKAENVELKEIFDGKERLKLGSVPAAETKEVPVIEKAEVVDDLEEEALKHTRTN